MLTKYLLPDFLNNGEIVLIIYVNHLYLKYSCLNYMLVASKNFNLNLFPIGSGAGSH